MGILPVPVLLEDVPGVGKTLLAVLVLLAGKMPALQEVLGYFLNWKSPINYFRNLIVSPITARLSSNKASRPQRCTC
jgi:hypothetical protein